MFENAFLGPYLLVSLPFAGAVGFFLAVLIGERVKWFFQFVKYGAVGVITTYIHVAVFYLLATTCLLCLSPDDWAVEHLAFRSAEVSDSVRAFRFMSATAVGFTVANVICWILNRLFVFKPGKFRWYVEISLFFAVSLLATLIALGASAVLIRLCGLMTTIALFVEIAVSFLLNYFIRKFIIFRG